MPNYTSLPTSAQSANECKCFDISAQFAVLNCKLATHESVFCLIAQH